MDFIGIAEAKLLQFMYPEYMPLQLLLLFNCRFSYLSKIVNKQHKVLMKSPKVIDKLSFYSLWALLLSVINN